MLLKREVFIIFMLFNLLCVYMGKMYSEICTFPLKDLHFLFYYQKKYVANTSKLLAILYFRYTVVYC